MEKKEKKIYYVAVRITTIRQYRVSAPDHDLACRQALALAFNAVDAGSLVETISVEEEGVAA